MSVIKEKLDRILKGITSAESKKQIDWFSKHENVSPTFHSDQFVMVTAIDAMERRDVAAACIKGSHLHDNQRDFTAV